VREAAESFVSALFPHSTKLLGTQPLEAMVVGAFVRGLSMRDVESLCEEAGLGKLSKSTASRICCELRERFEQFKRRDLYEIKLVALFLDAIFLNVRPKGPKEGVLCAWGFTESGDRVLIGRLARDARVARGLARPRTRPDRTRPWGADADRRRRRPRPDQGGRAVLAGLGPPALLRSPRPEPDREAARARSRADAQGLLQGARRGQGRARRQSAAPGPRRRARASRLRLRCALLADDLEALVVHLRYPLRHRKRWRSTNLLERTLGEVKRRTKVIGRFPGEESCLSLVWAVLDLQINNACNGVKLSDIDRHKLYRLRYDPGESRNERDEVTAA
jgi:putative transposase